MYGDYFLYNERIFYDRKGEKEPVHTDRGAACNGGGTCGKRGACGTDVRVFSGYVAANSRKILAVSSGK